MRAFGRNLFWPAHPEDLAAAGSLPELQVSEALGIAAPMGSSDGPKRPAAAVARRSGRAR
jgi:hypothetical protein